MLADTKFGQAEESDEPKDAEGRSQIGISCEKPESRLQSGLAPSRLQPGLQVYNCNWFALFLQRDVRTAASVRSKKRPFERALALMPQIDWCWPDRQRKAAILRTHGLFSSVALYQTPTGGGGVKADAGGWR